MNPQQWFNAAEAGLWFIAGAAFLLASLKDGSHRLPPILTALLFWLFAISDLVEIRTGAWWRPWWLLTWKGLCMLGLFLLFWTERRERKKDGEKTATDGE